MFLQTVGLTELTSLLKMHAFFLWPPIRCKTFFVNHTKSVEEMLLFWNGSHFISSVRSFRNTFKLLIKHNLIQVGGLTSSILCVMLLKSSHYLKDFFRRLAPGSELVSVSQYFMWQSSSLPHILCPSVRFYHSISLYMQTGVC